MAENHLLDLFDSQPIAGFPKLQKFRGVEGGHNLKLTLDILNLIMNSKKRLRCIQG